MKKTIKNGNRINKKAFSLVELLVVITIMAILSVVAYTAVGGQTVKARNAKRLQDLNGIQSALELYFVEYSRYPETLEIGEATSTDDWKIPKKYLSKIPLDPKKTGTPATDQPYKYGFGTNGKTYQIAATIENEEDGSISAYVAGNGEDLIDGGATYVPTTGVCGGVSENNIKDGDTTKVPYCLN